MILQTGGTAVGENKVQLLLFGQFERL